MFVDVYKAIDDIADYLVSQGVGIPDAYKRRDPDEPGRAVKEMYEDKLARLMRKRFKTQKEKIADALRWTLPKKNVGDWMGRIGDLSDPDTESLIFSLFVSASDHSTQLFGENVAGYINYDSVNIQVTDWARGYQTKWLKDLDSITRKKLRSELVNFASIEGYSVGDVMSGLSDTVLGGDRARRVAVTEITRVYGQSEQIAGELVAKEYPDVRVIKTWFTNADAKTCEICEPLHGRVVLIGEEFTDGIDFPPAHVNCRCWMSSRTDIKEDVELHD